MRLLIKFCLILLILSGCSTKATLYPVEGPMAQEQPLPVIVATAYGTSGNTGDISLTLPDGEQCKGRWSVIAPLSFGFASASANSTVTTGMASAWGTVYGSGYSIGNRPGVNRGEAVLVGDKSTTIQMEFFTGSGTGHGTGVAKDNKGNFFKVIF